MGFVGPYGPMGCVGPYGPRIKMHIYVHAFGWNNGIKCPVAQGLICCVTLKHVLKSLSVSYQKKAWLGWWQPSLHLACQWQKSRDLFWHEVALILYEHKNVSFLSANCETQTFFRLLVSLWLQHK